MRRVVRHPEAYQELEVAALWYEQQQPGLGENFLEEYEATLRRILDDPKRWHKIRGDNRKLNLHDFPFAIVYEMKGDTIYLRAVMHLHRRPAYWSQRQFPR